MDKIDISGVRWVLVVEKEVCAVLSMFTTSQMLTWLLGSLPTTRSKLLSLERGIGRGYFGDCTLGIPQALLGLTTELRAKATPTYAHGDSLVVSQTLPHRIFHFMRLSTETQTAWQSCRHTNMALRLTHITIPE